MRKSFKEEQLRIIETLLVHKADPVHIRGTSYDMSALDLAANHAEPEVFNLIKDFAADMASVISSPNSLPTSPVAKSPTPNQITTTSTTSSNTTNNTQIPLNGSSSNGSLQSGNKNPKIFQNNFQNKTIKKKLVIELLLPFIKRVANSKHLVGQEHR